MSIFNDRFRRAAKESGLSFAEIGRLVGRTRQAVGGWARNDTEPDLEIIQQLAVILKKEPHWLSPGLVRQTIAVEGLPLRGKIAAGVWHEVFENQDPDIPRRPVAPDSRYPIAAQYVLEVDGNSVNKLARHGSLLTCVDCMAGNLDPRPGDLVVVERRRAGLVETTVKRLVSVNGALELWPESDDPAHQERLVLGPPRADTAIEVKAIVVWTSNPIPRGD